MKNTSLLIGGLVGGILLSNQAFAAEIIKPTSLPNANQFKSSTPVASVRDAILNHYNMNSDYQLEVKTSFLDKVGNTHSRMQLRYKGMPVWGHQVISHTLRQGKGLTLSGSLVAKIEQDISTDEPPKYTGEQIVTLMKPRLDQKLGKFKHYDREDAELVIYFDSTTGKARRAYHVDVFGFLESGEPARYKMIVDAENSSVLRSWNAMASADIHGPGGNTKTGRYEFGVDYDALNGTDLGNGQCSLENENVRAVDLMHTFNDFLNDPFIFDCSENTYKEINGAYSPINDAFYFGNLAFDMFRDWYETAPLPFQLSMKVHFGDSHENAYWTGSAMLFGDGQSLFYPLVDVNVSVHEVSHGFTEFNSNLIYANESGGMNEAFSDIAGEAAEYYWKGEVDWLVGGDIFKAENQGLRFFEDPTLDGVSIGHFNDYVDGMDVHFSSGVYNRAYYLLSNTEGWNPRTAFDVFVLANQAYWSADETMAGGACGLIQAAFDLEYQWLDVYASLATVGVQCTTNTIDEDNDGMSDIAELVIGFDASSAEDALLDFDGDGMSNRAEFNAGTDPKDIDTDDDGLSDSDEISLIGSSPLLTDSDDDGIADGWEVEFGLNPFYGEDANEDTDNDGVSNLREYQTQTDPTDANDFIPAGLNINTVFDFEDQDSSEFVPFAGANGAFVVDDRYAFEGTYSLANDDIDDGEFALVELYANTEDGELTFDLKTSTEEFWDFFRVYIDFELVYEQSGDYDWQEISIPITQGEHIIAFSYFKDGIISAFEDTVWIDNVFYSGLAVDSDEDGMTDEWETLFGLDPEDAADGGLDGDEDGLTNLEEFTLLTDPTEVDSDGDLLADGAEVADHLTSPTNADTDGDYVSDGEEVAAELDPLDAADGAGDLDNDTFSNSLEGKYGSDINDATSMPSTVTVVNETFSSVLSDLWTTPHTLETWDTNNGVLRSQAVSNGKAASIEMANLFSAGTLYFDYIADTEEGADYLEVWVDGEKVVNASGDVSDSFELEIAQGEHTISYVYRKNAVASSTLDFASIDNMAFFVPDGDEDSDGLSNVEEYKTLGTDFTNADTDGDSVNDGVDVFPLDETESVDTDGDGTGNNADTDDDNDGVEDAEDAFPLDASESIDTDGDGTGNNADTDDDNDGVADTTDAFPLDASESVDTDGDGIGNNADTDDDNDGVADATDAFPLDSTRSEQPSSGGSSGPVLLLIGFVVMLSRRYKLSVRR